MDARTIQSSGVQNVLETKINIERDHYVDDDDGDAVIIIKININDNNKNCSSGNTEFVLRAMAGIVQERVDKIINFHSIKVTKCESG